MPLLRSLLWISLAGCALACASDGSTPAPAGTGAAGGAGATSTGGSSGVAGSGGSTSSGSAGGMSGSGAAAGHAGAPNAGSAGSAGGGAGAGAGSSEGGASGAEPEDGPIVPAGLSVMPLEGGNGVLRVTALTLRAGANNPELYAALVNDGDVPACDAGLSVELYSWDQQSLTAGINGLATKDFYRFNDDSGTITSCVAPGSVAMAAILDLPADLAVGAVGYVVYRCPYFALDVSPIAGLSVDDLQPLTRAGGTAYGGTLTNGLDVAVTLPSVAVFALNAAGRPLARATALDTEDLAAGDGWAFETDSIAEAGTTYLAFPGGTPAP